MAKDGGIFQTLWRFRLVGFMIVLVANGRADQSITIRSGGGSINSLDSQVRYYSFGTTGDITPSPDNFASAQAGPFAYVVAPYSAYLSALPHDPAAKWVARAVGWPAGTTIYAIPFQLTDATITAATLDFHFSVDNAVNGVFLNGLRISGNSYDGDYHAEYDFARSDIASLLIPNSTNWLYVNASDYGGLAALMFSATITTVGGVSAGVLPSTGGNAGAATVKIFGQGFPQPPAAVAVTLRAAGQSDILGLAPLVISSDEIDTTFNLRGAPPGTRDVVITSSGQTILTRANAFTIVAGGSPQLSVNVVGPNQVRAGRQATVDIVVTNSGLIDAEFVKIQVGGQGVTLASTSQTPSLTARTFIPELAGGLTCSGFGNLTGLRIPAGGSGTFSGICTPSGTSCSTLTPTVSQNNSEGGDPCEEERQVVADLQREIADTNSHLANIMALFNAQLALFDAFGCQNVTVLNAIACAFINNELSELKQIGQGLIDLINQLQESLTLAEKELADCEAAHGQNANVITNRFEMTHPQVVTANIASAAASSPSSTSLTVCGVTSVDPNGKTGITGVGALQYVRGDVHLIYTVNFENLPTAGAAAVNVVVSDPLSASLDASTVDVRTITFGNTTLQLPSGTQQYNTLVDLRPSQNLLVKVSVSLASNVLNLTLGAIDPATGQPPSDPSIGVLPPDKFPPEGEGSITFAVRPKQDLITGIQIQNQATITFDNNAPISTPVWTNTIDNTNPISNVLFLPATQNSGSFPVQWQASDVGAGVQNVTVFVSNNGGPFVPWLVQAAGSQASFSGQVGHTYSFFSIAEDGVGNLEGSKNAGEATTTVQSGVVGDVNGDGRVDCADIAIVRAAFGTHAGDLKYDARADVNGDGIVDIRDLAFVSQHLSSGTVCQ